jgi:hypothetical protein
VSLLLPMAAASMGRQAAAAAAELRLGFGWIYGAVYIEVRFARGVEVLLDLECPSALGLRHA